MGRFLLLAAASAFVIAACSSFSSEGVPTVDPTAEGGVGQEDASRGDETNPPMTVEAGPGKYEEVVLADKPLAYWRLDEGASPFFTTPMNSSWTMTAANVSGVAGTAGVAGSKAVAFKEDGKLVSASSLPFGSTHPFSIELWVLVGPASNAARIARWGAANAPSGADAIDIRVTAGSTLSFAVERGAQRVEKTLVTAGGGYHHVVAAYDGMTMTLYVDGGAAPFRPDIVPIVAAAETVFEIGSFDSFDGALDEVAIYSAPLTGTQVAAHYFAGRGQ